MCKHVQQGITAGQGSTLRCVLLILHASLYPAVLSVDVCAHVRKRVPLAKACIERSAWSAMQPLSQ